MSQDPLLQPYQLKHLTLRNRVMTTSHDLAYPEDDMPKERYIAFPKVMEDWDIASVIADFADAAERMQAGGMDGSEIEAYGHRSTRSGRR